MSFSPRRASSPRVRRPPRIRAGPSAPGTFPVMYLLEVGAGPNRVVSFDGRVLEVFGGSVRRFHVNLLSVTVSGPDKHGNRNVVLRQADVDNSLPVDEPAYAQLQPLLEALRSAGVSVAG
jgi:hypothetical protein